MQAVDSEYGPVNIVIPGFGAPRFGGFEMDLMRLQMPRDSTISRTFSGSVAFNRNISIANARDAAHHLLLDDDQGFPPNALMTLLAHKKPIVGAFITSKMPPYAPIVTKAQDTWPDTGRPRWQIYTWDELDELSGLLPVFATGTGCLLVSKEVIDTIPQPWFEIGKYASDDLHEDMYFMEKARSAGFQPYVDLDLPITHWDVTSVGPTRGADGRRTVRLHFTNGETVLMGRSDPPKPTVKPLKVAR